MPKLISNRFFQSRTFFFSLSESKITVTQDENSVISIICCINLSLKAGSYQKESNPIPCSASTHILTSSLLSECSIQKVLQDSCVEALLST